MRAQRSAWRCTLSSSEGSTGPFGASVTAMLAGGARGGVAGEAASAFAVARRGRRVGAEHCEEGARGRTARGARAWRRGGARRRSPGRGRGGRTRGGWPARGRCRTRPEDSGGCGRRGDLGVGRGAAAPARCFGVRQQPIGSPGGPVGERRRARGAGARSCGAGGRVGLRRWGDFGRLGARRSVARRPWRAGPRRGLRAALREPSADAEARGGRVKRENEAGCDKVAGSCSLRRSALDPVRANHWTCR